MPVCTQCSSDYDRIATHWTRSSSCQHPHFTDRQWNILIGLLMGDGHVDDLDGRNPRFTVNMITREYLTWLDSVFSPLSAGVRHDRTAERSAEQSGVGSGNAENYSDVYRWTTIRHPELTELREWYSSGSKIWPEIELNPTIIKHLYVSDGNYEKHNSSNHIRIHCAKELGEEEKIERMFDESGYPVQAWRKQPRKDGGTKVAIDFSVDVSNELWKDMGSPPPGFEYKWPQGSDST